MPKGYEMADLNQFTPLLEEADRAYRADVAYSVAICSAARSIESKREVWKLRLELREASKQAQSQCRKAESFVCVTEAPCGLGTCKFAKGEFTQLDIISPGNTQRPQYYSKGPYGLEACVEELKKLRADSTNDSD